MKLSEVFSADFRTSRGVQGKATLISSPVLEATDRMIHGTLLPLRYIRVQPLIRFMCLSVQIGDQDRQDCNKVRQTGIPLA